MMRTWIAILLCLTMAHCQVLGGKQVSQAVPNNKGVWLKLRAMVKIDQDLRLRLIESMKANKMADFEVLEKQLRWIDRENTGQLQQIVRTYGWPTKSLVGKEGASNAFLIVQHADLNPKFQRQCLDLMTPLLHLDEVNKRDYAYLTDRVLLAEGKKQIYGSQFEKDKSGRWVPRALEDPDNVDKRRAVMGMEPISEYQKLIEKMYGGG